MKQLTTEQHSNLQSLLFELIPHIKIEFDRLCEYTVSVEDQLAESKSKVRELELKLKHSSSQQHAAETPSVVTDGNECVYEAECRRLQLDVKEKKSKIAELMDRLATVDEEMSEIFETNRQLLARNMVTEITYRALVAKKEEDHELLVEENKQQRDQIAELVTEDELRGIEMRGMDQDYQELLDVYEDLEDLLVQREEQIETLEAKNKELDQQYHAAVVVQNNLKQQVKSLEAKSKIHKQHLQSTQLAQHELKKRLEAATQLNSNSSQEAMKAKIKSLMANKKKLKYKIYGPGGLRDKSMKHLCA